MSASLGGTPGGAISAFRRAALPAEESRALARIAKEPDLARTMEQFRRAVDRAPDARTALRDPRVLAGIGQALGIPQAATQPGLASRALLSDLTKPGSVANNLPDKRWKEAAASLKLATAGIQSLRDPKVQATLLDGLRRARLREEQDMQTPGLGDALEFRNRAARAKTSFDVLGDPVLRPVVTGALGLPQQLALQSVEAQGRAVDSRLKVATLQNPGEVKRLAERYLVKLSTSAGAGLPDTSGLAQFGFNV
ncbi:MAG: DUF1217 domain-containing protein [Rubritepida sp.]|nr:DUF1217 domain-containing protein [Rubritepida sp.]